ncbi:MAG: bestrophin family protein [Labilithrix sp.]
MWVDRPSWLKTVVLGGFALPHIWLRTGIVTALSIVTTFLWEEFKTFHYSISPVPFTLIGLPLGIFLGFRNNAAYDRFWEGRKLWGGLVNVSRTLTRQILTLIEAPDADPEELKRFETSLVRYVIGYFHAVRHHLRDHEPWEVLSHNMLSEEDIAHLKKQGKTNVPIAMLQEIGDRIVHARRKNWIHPFHVPTIEQSLANLTDLQGGCERIKLTPIPYSYTVLLHRIVAFYCALLPFGIMDAAKWATPLVVLSVSYCFFGLDAVGDELEQPFGTDVNDLPLHAITRTIERNLRERIGDEIPQPLQPQKGVLN